jgi:hypothetical protein
MLAEEHQHRSQHQLQQPLTSLRQQWLYHHPSFHPQQQKPWRQSRSYQRCQLQPLQQLWRSPLPEPSLWPLRSWDHRQQQQQQQQQCWSFSRLQGRQRQPRPS